MHIIFPSSSSAGTLPTLDSQKYACALEEIRAVLINAKQEQEALQAKYDILLKHHVHYEHEVKLLTEEEIKQAYMFHSPGNAVSAVATPQACVHMPLMYFQGLEKTAALEKENGKLKYQVLHLKRAVAEGDRKASAT